MQGFSASSAKWSFKGRKKKQKPTQNNKLVGCQLNETWSPQGDLCKWLPLPRAACWLVNLLNCKYFCALQMVTQSLPSCGGCSLTLGVSNAHQFLPTERFGHIYSADVSAKWSLHWRRTLTWCTYLFQCNHFGFYAHEEISNKNPITQSGVKT